MTCNRENTKPTGLQPSGTSREVLSDANAYRSEHASVKGWSTPPPSMVPPTSVFALGKANILSQSVETSRPARADHDHIQNAQRTSMNRSRGERMQGSPLKVRKTRENLRQVITQSQETKTNSTPVVPGNSGFENTRPLRSEDHRPLTHHSTMDTLSLSSPAYSVMHVENSRGSAVTQPVARRQSVRKRVVSRMKEGLLSRSKSISKVSFPDQADALNRSETLSARGGEVKFTGGGSHHVRNQSAQTLPALLGGTSGTVEDLPPSSQEEQNLIPLSRTPELDDASQVQEVMPDISPRSQHSIQESRPSRITPPLSCSPSPEQTPRPARRPTRLIEEAEVSHRPEILHVALTIVPAVAAVDINDDANTWVKIEAEAKIDTPVIEATSRSEGAVGNGFESQHAIDLILIVDNSALVTVRTLQDICDIIHHICSCLQMSDDRLAVFCTNCPHQGMHRHMMSGCQLHRLQKPNTAIIATELERLQLNPAEDLLPDRDPAHLLQDVVSFFKDRHGPSYGTLSARTHVLVLSPQSHKYTSSLCKASPWPVHQINVGLCRDIPVSLKHCEHRGWFIDWSRNAGDTGSLHGFGITAAMIARMVRQVRTSMRLGELSHVKVAVNGGEQCRIKDVLAPTRSMTLKAGQRTTIFVKVTVPPVPPHETQLSEEAFDEAYNDLSQLLGLSATKLFTAEVSYRHSLLPANTTLTISQTCRVQRSNPQSIWGDYVGNPSVSNAVKHGKAVFIARHYPPDVALKLLQRKCEASCREPGHPSGIHEIQKELEYQRDMQLSYQKQDTANEQQKTVPMRDAGRRLTFHIYDTDACQAFYALPQLTESDTPPITPSSTIKPLYTHARTESAMGEDFPPDRDAARQIWRHMRHNSRSTSLYSMDERRPSNESLQRLEAADERLREIRRQALQNKRSVGADTLRDFQWGGMSGGGAGERSAPWL